MANVDQLRDDIPFEIEDEAGLSFITFWTPILDAVPEWWSPARDKWLQKFWKKHDPTKIGVTTFTSKALSIPVRIRPKNTLIDIHVQQAEEFEHALLMQSGIFKGFEVEFEKFVQDYLTTDNGGFFLVMGNGSANGPIVGPPSGVYHLDSSRCQRTSNPEFPVIYLHTDGRRYKLHYTRVISISHLSSPDAEMYGVGLCSVSCALDAARELKDIIVYGQEKMGTRPNRDILYAETGATIDMLQAAVRHAQQKMDSEGLTTFSKTLLLAPKVASGTLKLDKIELSNTPDGFDREKVTLMDMAIVAAAFGLDLRDISFNLVSSQTRADAEIQDRKGRGKGVGTLLDKVTTQLNLKFLPGHLYATFDNQDDDQDEQQANIWNVRSQARDRDLTSGAVTVRVARQRMLRLGEITEEEFEYMELLDGRLPNGLDVFSLFHVRDSLIRSLLSVDVNDPFSDPVDLSLVRERIADATTIIHSTSNRAIASKARQALAALLKLEAQELSRQAEEEAALLAVDEEEALIEEEETPVSSNGVVA